MKLLICTQAVDGTDSDLGFFVRWIEEFAQHCEAVTVICLREGKHSLPKKVRVLSLGKKSRLVRSLHLLRLCISERKSYDAVFVHMNPEYLVVAGMLWRFLGKRTALWYTHKSVNMRLRIATLFADIVFSASPESFRLPTKKLRVMGHGIDTHFFTPDPTITRGDWYLSVGRLMPSKDHRMAIVEARNHGEKLRIAGEGPERESLEAYSRSLGATVEFLGGLSHAALRDEYRTAKLLIHTSKTGSLDKVVLEALACGLPVHSHDPALASLENAGPEYVRKNHSLVTLISRIMDAYVHPRV